MRSLLISIAAMIALSLAFTLYTRMQPAINPVRQSTGINATPATANETPGTFTSGSRPWVQEFSETTGNIKYQFRADRFDRQPDGTDKVLNPEAEFFMGEEKVAGAGRRKLRVVGKTGDVVTTSVKRAKQNFGSGETRLPTRGVLHDVVIYLYASDHDAQPELTAVMNNAAFDNDTFRIYTEEFVAPDGKKIPADEVPVTVRGTDFDFDGRGLIVRMDELDKQLRSLEIVHGQRLLVKHSGSLSAPMLGEPQSDAGPLPFMLASAEKTAGAQPIRRAPTRKRALPKPSTSLTTLPARTGVYRATFFDKVHVAQADQGTVDASRMEVDFYMKQKEEESATTQPGRAGKHPATTKAPATAKADQPVEVTWTGKLTIVPADQELEPGESIARFFGEPVIVHQKDNDIRCAELAYDSKQQVVLLSGSPNFPVQLKDSRGAIVKTDWMRYSALDRVATLQGHGEVTMPVKDEKTRKVQQLQARWARECEMEMSGGRKDEPLLIQHVAMRGDVDINHPQLLMQAQSLDLGFVPSKATTRPASDATGNAVIQTVNAAGNVHCIITEADQTKRTIDCQHLNLLADESASGAMLARRLDANGAVHALDNDRDLFADNLALDLTQNGATTELKKLVANGHVNAKTQGNSWTKGDDLLIEMQNAEPYVRVTGASGASVGSKDSTLTGPSIEFWKGQQRGVVKGAGRMTGTQHAQKDKPGTPIDITWADGIVLDGDKNRIDITGNVQVISKDNDGAVNTATGRKLALLLEAAPTTAPVTTKKSAEQVDFLAGKEVRDIRLTENVQVQSLLSAADGSVLRQMNLFAEQIDYDKKLGRMMVPVTGRLFFADLRPTTQPATQSGVPSGRGKTAMLWKKDMVYDDTNHLATATGSVRVVHESPSATERYELLADKVIAELMPPKDPKAPKATATDQTSQIKKVTATGNVTFHARKSEVLATSVEYDPDTQILIARGSDRLPAQVIDEKGNQSVFESVRYDARTGEVKSLKDFRGAVRTK